MISDAAPEAVQHVVLVEEVPPLGSDDHRWELTKTIPVDGGRASADARARELALEHVPGEISLSYGATAGRNVFRASDGSWLVEVTDHYRRVLVRITTAEQVHVQKYMPPPADDTGRPAKRRLFGRG